MIPPGLLEALAPVLRDLETTLPGMVRVEGPDHYPGWSYDRPQAWLVDASGGGTGLYDLPGTRAGRVAVLADQVQEVVLETVWAVRGRGDAWPPCPEHPGGHPLAAADLDEAVWRCPVSLAVHAVVGELQPPAPTSRRGRRAPRRS